MSQIYIKGVLLLHLGFTNPYSRCSTVGIFAAFTLKSSIAASKTRASMRQIMLSIDPSVWNVLTFIALSLIITPIIETLLQSLISSRVTLSVLTGNQVQIFDSRIGIFALHSKYTGSSRNRLWLVCGAVFTLSTQLLLEYSFSSTQTDQFESVAVWQGSDHHIRYFGVNETFIDDEPTRFLESVATACVDGPRAFNRSKAQIPNYPQVKAQLSYNASFNIRVPYMRADTADVACGITKKEQYAYFMIPSIVEAYNGYEGLNSECEVDPYGAYPFWFERLLKEKMQLRGSFDFEGNIAQMLTGEHTVCLSQDTRGICAISNGTEIIIGRSSHGNELHIMRCIHMFISGEGMQRLHEPGRKVRFLAYLVETRLFNPSWARHIENLVPRSTLERIVQVAIVVANEVGVVGVEESVSSRDVVLPEKRNATTISMLAFVPATLLLLIVLILAGCDMLVRIKLAKIEGNEKGLFRSAFSHSRVNLSMDWVRDRVAADLTRSDIRKCTSEEIRVRLVGHGDKSHLQVLPDGMERMRRTSEECGG